MLEIAPYLLQIKFTEFNFMARNIFLFQQWKVIIDIFHFLKSDSCVCEKNVDAVSVSSDFSIENYGVY